MQVTKVQEFMAELLGTFILISFGCGCVAMVNLFPANGVSALPGEVVKGGYTNIVVGWAMAVTFGVIVAYRISGAHLNPAVTLALWVVKKFPTSKIFHYLVAQFLGAFLAAACVFAVFYCQWIKIDPTFSNTSSIFTTFPSSDNWSLHILDHIVGTFLLVFLIFALSSFYPKAAESFGLPFAIGAIVLALGISFGGMNGFPINPARDFAPRVFAWVVGFSNTGFSEMKVWLMPIICPLIGGMLGSLFYQYVYVKWYNGNK